MAGNKINTKKKDDKSKSSRNADQAIEETEDIDFSQLRKPILTSVTGFAQARKIFDLATEELKGLLSNECDLLYECKVCRNIFRSLANFISHKRVYCIEKFNSSVHGHFLKQASVVEEVLKIRKLEESYQESLNEKLDTNCPDEDDSARIPITKDLTSIVENITKNKGVPQSELENKQLVFQKIPKSSVAVFQNVHTSGTKTDTMKTQVAELNKILSQENAVLQSDGTFKVQGDDKIDQNSDNVIQISDDDENEESDNILKCKICDLQFSTLKTLKFHIKYKHLENRLVYPCPDCLDIFSTSWSVYRHLFKVHRKTAAQIRRLRESIQAKAFRMNNPPAFYEKRKTVTKTVPTQKITEEERLYKENQAWLEELDGESEGRRCGGCGRTFERRAALAAHTHTCARRHRRRIQIQIRKDYHKEPNNPYLTLAGGTTPISTDTKSNPEFVETTEKVQLEKDIKDDNEDDPLVDAEMDIVSSKTQQDETEEMETDDKPIVQNSKQNLYHNSMINKLPFSQQIEKNNLNAFKQKIQLDINIEKFSCKKCDIKYDTIHELLDHMAEHYKWVRYACKLCNFKHFNFEKLPEHVRIVHKLKGNTDFYFSTVKALDGNEALELSESNSDVAEVNEPSPDSRRPSRCSSDSSRLSDDSSSSSTRIETGSRKRKANIYKANAKKKKEAQISDENDQKEDSTLKDVIVGENETIHNNKIFEENSSDLDEVEEKSSKRQSVSRVPSSVASRRPVRKKTKPKNADFEYDLSNLLKMEAQGYRDSQVVCSRPVQTKKKTQQDIHSNYDIINKDCCGAMITLSRKSVEIARAHMKTASFPVFKTSKESRISSIFARPMIPKNTRMDKMSPKKVGTEESNDISSPSKVTEPTSNVTSITQNLTPKELTNKSEQEVHEQSEKEKCVDGVDTKEDSTKVNAVDTVLINDSNKNNNDSAVLSPGNEKKLDSENDETCKIDEVCKTDETCNTDEVCKTDETRKTDKNSGNTYIDTAKANLNMVPIKFRRQSLEVIKNPLIKKNITDFTKAGMKTKILVIKPINRNADRTQNLNAPLKFPTIKLIAPSKSNVSNEEKKSDQEVAVQVPKLECAITKAMPSNSIVNKKNSTVVADSITCEDEKSDKDILSNNETSSIIENKTDKIPENSEDILNQMDGKASQLEQVISGSVNDANEVLMDADAAVGLGS